MKQVVDVALVGAGGFGSYYLNELLFFNQEGRVRLTSVVDPYPEHCRFLEELNARDIPIYADLSDVLVEGRAALIFIASPIQWHASQTIACVEKGLSVLCEKPVCATIQDARRMAQAEQQAEGFVGIGYQWSFSEAIQSLKHDIMHGDLGHPLRLKSRIYWPRPKSYYERNRWAGRIALDDGTWVLDSPAGNATAHYLHNMLYVLGETRETSAHVTSVQAELFRANPIENYDTIAMRGMTNQDVELFFYATHASENNINPIFDFEFEQAVVTYSQDEGGTIVAKFHDGHVKDYGDPFYNRASKIWQSVDALYTGEPLACGIEAATPHTLCINGTQESAPMIVDFPASLLHTKPLSDSQVTYVEGLEQILTHCYDSHCLPSESGLADWAVAGKVIDLRNYDYFPRHASDVN